MNQISGFPVKDIVESGVSEDGKHVFFRLIDNNHGQLTLILPHEIIGHVVGIIEGAAKSAYQLRITRNPSEAQDGLVTPPKLINSLAVMTSPDHPGLLFEMMTYDKVPLSVQVPLDIAKQLHAGLGAAIDGAGRPFVSPPTKKH